MRVLAVTILATALLTARGVSADEPATEPAAKPATTPPAPPGDLPLQNPGELARRDAPRGDLPRVELHGGAYFWLYQPLSNTVDASPEDRNLELYLASLDFEGRLGDFGLVLNPRFRDSEAREFFTSNVWIEEAYAYYKREYITIKTGKVYSQLSRLSDDTFYGNLPYFDGIKLDANYGISAEGSASFENGWGIGYFAQYFLLDGGTNGSLHDRDTVWVDGIVRRNHTTVARFEPSYRWNPKASIRAGLAAGYCFVDFKQNPQSHVFRLSGDVSVAYGPVRAFAEFITQTGQTVTDYPIPRTAPDVEPAERGKASSHNQYAVLGFEAQVWRFTPRYSFSFVQYRDLHVVETLHVPGVTFTINDNISLMLEYAYWSRTDPGDKSSTLDNSFNGVVYARF